MSYLNRVNSPEKAQAFLEALLRHGMLYHPEESAMESLAGHGLGKVFLWQIDQNMRRCFEYLDDPCESAAVLLRNDPPTFKS